VKAYIISGPQNLGADNLKLMDIPTPNATDDLVLIQTEAVGLNPVDYKLALSSCIRCRCSWNNCGMWQKC